MKKNFKSLGFSALIFTCWVALFSGPRFTSNDSTIRLRNATSQLILYADFPTFDGTLRVDEDALGRVVAQSVVFDRGVIRSDSGLESTYTGTFWFDWDSNMYIEDGGIVDFKSGKIMKKVVVYPAATVSIMGAPEFTYDTTLTNSTSTLNLGIQSKFSQNLNLNSGKLLLKDELRFKGDSKILNGGTIDINGHSLKIPTGDYANADLIYENAKSIICEGDILLGNQHLFQGVGGASNVSGNGFVLECSTGGKIKVGPDHQLCMTNLHFKNIGDGADCGAFEIDSTSTLMFQDCTIELCGLYTHGSGTLEFRDGCKVIHHGYDFDVTNSGYILLNGASLIYDSLSRTDKNPFTFTDVDSQKIVLLGGEIRSSALSSPLVLDGQDLDFYSDYVLSLQNGITVKNDDFQTTKDVTLDFKGHAITFPRESNPLVKLDPKIRLKLKNCELFEYNQNSISYGDANSCICFGSGVKIRLMEPVKITASDRDWHFIGDSVIGGKNSSLQIFGSQRIKVANSSTLRLEDLRISIDSLDSIKLLDPGCKLVFDNCDFMMGPAGFLFDNGDIEVEGRMRVFGGCSADLNVESNFSMTTTGTFKVLNGSLLRLGKCVKFSYKADPANDGGSVYASKRHFLLEGAKSVLELDGCTVNSSSTGLAIDHGRLIVSDNSELITDGFNGTEAEIGSALDLYIKPSVELSVTGTLAYNLTSLP